MHALDQKCERPDLAPCAQVVYHWAKGVAFKEICGLTDVLEGSIVRTIVRLDETCRRERPACALLPQSVRCWSSLWLLAGGWA